MRIPHRRSAIGFLAPLFLLGCLRSAPPTEPIPPSTHETNVLFVGNSLTYMNDLPGVFRDLAIAGGHDVGVAMIAQPNMALIDYVTSASVLQSLAQPGWDYVVLQQGTTSVPICRDTLVLATKIMDSYIRQSGGKTALMMVWPSSDRQHVFPAVHDSWALAAQSVDGIFLPVGDAWLEAWKANPQQQLYDGDGYHPSPAATYLAALVMYEKFTGKDARQLPVNIRVGAGGFMFPAAEARLLQEAAHATNLKPVPIVQPQPAPVGPPIRC